MLTPEILLRGYSIGIFPMAERRDDSEIFWVDPRRRGVLPLTGFHVSRSLAKAIRSEAFEISFDADFKGVLNGCANRPDTWINEDIHQAYLMLYESGHAHSVEVWEQDRLVGGVYGVSIGAAFFGESMFSIKPNSSKIGLAFLTGKLRKQNFQLFDTQFLTPHLISLGAVELSREDYHTQLKSALESATDFGPADDIPSLQDVIQRKTHTS